MKLTSLPKGDMSVTCDHHYKVCVHYVVNYDLAGQQ